MKGLLILTVVFVLTACGGQSDEEKLYEHFREHGSEMTTDDEEEGYIIVKEIVTERDEELIDDLDDADDLTTPYYIKLSDDMTIQVGYSEFLMDTLSISEIMIEFEYGNVETLDVFFFNTFVFAEEAFGNPESYGLDEQASYDLNTNTVDVNFHYYHSDDDFLEQSIVEEFAHEIAEEVMEYTQTYFEENLDVPLK